MSDILTRIKNLPGITCPTCGGHGKVPDPRTIGSLLKTERKAKGLSLREIARRMEFTPAYISDLEHGRRAWGAKLRRSYIKAVK